MTAQQLAQQAKEVSTLKVVLTEEQLVLLMDLDRESRAAAAKYAGAVTAVLRGQMPATDAEGTWLLVGPALIRQARNGGQ